MRHRYSIFALVLLLSGPVRAQQPQTTSTYSATVAGAADCTAITLTVSRTIAADAQRTWISFTIRHCASGGSDAFNGPIVAQANQAIPDSDYSIGHSTESVRTQTAGGSVDVVWTVTPDVHLTYQAAWTNDTKGTITKSQEASDTKSATPTGSVAGVSVAPRSGYVITASGQQSAK
jgi:hypothetical protein